MLLNYKFGIRLGRKDLELLPALIIKGHRALLWFMISPKNKVLKNWKTIGLKKYI